MRPASASASALRDQPPRRRQRTLRQPYSRDDVLRLANFDKDQLRLVHNYWTCQEITKATDNAKVELTRFREWHYNHAHTNTSRWPPVVELDGETYWFVPYVKLQRILAAKNTVAAAG